MESTYQGTLAAMPILLGLLCAGLYAWTACLGKSGADRDEGPFPVRCLVLRPRNFRTEPFAEALSLVDRGYHV